MEILRTGFGMHHSIISTLSIIILQSVSVKEAVLISLLTEGQVFVLNHEQTLDISCEFITEEFNMFDNPVVWKKFQRQEETQINIMGNIFEPFLATNRFEVTFDDASPRYCLRLRIRNLTAEDSGNYTCEIRGRKSVVLAHITHFIFVRASVKMLFFTSTTNASSSSLSSSSSSSDAIPPLDSRLSRVVFVENRPQPIRCFSTGGYPAPDVAIRLNDRDITDQFTLSSSTSFYGKPGLRLMVTQTERSTEGLRLSANDDESRLKCIVTVPGLTPNVTETIVEVNYAPIITCSPAYAYVGQRDAVLRCEVRAKPEIMSLFWIIDINGTTLSKGEVTNEHWSLVMVRDDGVMETQLHVRQVLPQNLRSYTVVAENSIAINVQLVQLLSIKLTTPFLRATPYHYHPTTRHLRRHQSDGHPNGRYDGNQKYSFISDRSTSVATTTTTTPTTTTQMSLICFVVMVTTFALNVDTKSESRL